MVCDCMRLDSDYLSCLAFSIASNGWLYVCKTKSTAHWKIVLCEHRPHIKTAINNELVSYETSTRPLKKK